MRVVQSLRQTAVSAVIAETITYNRGSVISPARIKATTIKGEGNRKRVRDKLREGLAEANVFNHGHGGIAEFS